MKKLTMVLCALALSTSLFAIRATIGASAGTASFSDTFESGTYFEASTEFKLPFLGLGASVGYLTADAESELGIDLQAIPILIGSNYRFMLPGPIKPYFGAKVGLTALTGDLDGTQFTYGGKLGAMIETGSLLDFFVEGTYLSINGDDGNLEPMIYSAGVMLNLTPGKLIPGRKKDKKRGRKKPRRMRF